MGKPCVEYVTIRGLRGPQTAHERENLLIRAFVSFMCVCTCVCRCKCGCVFETARC